MKKLLVIQLYSVKLVSSLKAAILILEVIPLKMANSILLVGLSLGFFASRIMIALLGNSFKKVKDLRYALMAPSPSSINNPNLR